MLFVSNISWHTRAQVEALIQNKNIRHVKRHPVTRILNEIKLFSTFKWQIKIATTIYHFEVLIILKYDKCKL